MTDLTAAAFLGLREAVVQAAPAPRTYELRPKGNTQADPLDERIHEIFTERFPEDVYCIKASGPLITPDLVVLRPESCEDAARLTLRADPTRIVAIEVKKLERKRGGAIPRASGMDYNTTPPCGTVRV